MSLFIIRGDNITEKEEAMNDVKEESEDNQTLTVQGEQWPSRSTEETTNLHSLFIMTRGDLLYHLLEASGTLGFLGLHNDRSTCAATKKGRS